MLFDGPRGEPGDDGVVTSVRKTLETVIHAPFNRDGFQVKTSSTARRSGRHNRTALASMERFLGGSPLRVLIRLVFISLIVGAILAFLGLSPQSLYESAVRFLRSLTGMGFGAVRDVGQWIVAGAMIVIPLWLISRLFAARR
ncbi:DUF6460 domain-containing protein [Bosea sp. (in: a-proteobacteria)]|uniref:DUF6460 domain-containing protein n=1 Tax=Bosea sp. (in: a-proteobacteria) TaxID=1871050 RepID=UPI003B3A46DF